MPAEEDTAKGHLAASIALGMTLKPHIVHIVGYCEADHAAGADDIIKSCKIARGAIDLALGGLPEAASDPAIDRRRRCLVKEAKAILNAIKKISKKSADPLCDPFVLKQAVRDGFLDAPHLCGNSAAQGAILTGPSMGRYVSLDPRTGRAISEFERLKKIKSGLETITLT